MHPAETMQKACQLAGWHLYEARRFFSEIALPLPDLNAAKLDKWLISKCAETGEGSVSRSEILQRSPIRKAGVLNSALDKLQSAYRVRSVKEGNAAIVEINPALLKGGA